MREGGISVPGTPFRIVSNTRPSLALRTNQARTRSGPRPPSPFDPWQALQPAPNSFRPALIAAGWSDRGFLAGVVSGRAAVLSQPAHNIQAAGFMPGPFWPLQL